MNIYRKYGLAILAGTLLLTGWAGNALALTDACTPINNRATLSYSVGAFSGTVESAPGLGNSNPGVGNGSDTTFSVASLVNLTNIASNTPTGAPAQTNRVLTFRIENTGNEDARYMLRLYDRDGATVDGHTDNFNMTDVRVYADITDGTWNNGTLDTDEFLIAASEANQLGANLDLAPAPGNEAVVVAPGGFIYVHVVANVPNTATNGQKDLFTLVAKAYHDTDDSTGSAHGTVGGWVESTNVTTNGCLAAVVLGDTTDEDGTGGSPALDLDSTTPDGDEPATGYFLVQTAAITVRKIATPIWDPINGAGIGTAKAIPGAVVRYTITITNSGASAADSVSLTDDIPLNTYLSTYEAVLAADSTTIEYDDGGGYSAVYTPTDNSPGGSLDYDSNVTSLQVTYASIAGGGTVRTITFPVYIQ